MKTESDNREPSDEEVGNASGDGTSTEAPSSAGESINYLEQLCQSMTPKERLEMSMLLAQYTQKDRQSGMLSMDDEDNNSNPTQQMESGSNSDNMSELGR